MHMQQRPTASTHHRRADTAFLEAKYTLCLCMCLLSDMRQLRLHCISHLFLPSVSEQLVIVHVGLIPMDGCLVITIADKFLLLDESTHCALLHVGAQCPKSHGLAEALLHPCSYRTAFCTDPMCGGDLACALAHSWEELRLPECMPAPYTNYLAAQDEVGNVSSDGKTDTLLSSVHHVCALCAPNQPPLLRAHVA